MKLNLALVAFAALAFSTPAFAHKNPDNCVNYKGNWVGAPKTVCNSDIWNKRGGGRTVVEPPKKTPAAAPTAPVSPAPAS